MFRKDKLKEEYEHLKKEFEELKKKKIYVVQPKSTLTAIYLLAGTNIVVGLALGGLAFILKLKPLIIVGLLVITLFTGLALLLIVQTVPWVRTLLEYYFTNKKLVLEFNPEQKRVQLKTWIEKDGFLYDEKGNPIVIDQESIYTFAKGHQLYLYLTGRVKTFTIKKVILNTIDEATGNSQVYTYEPAIVLTTSDIERIFKRIKAEKVSKDLQMLEEHKPMAIKIGGITIPIWLIIGIFVIILIVVLGLGSLQGM